MRKFGLGRLLVTPGVRSLVDRFDDEALENDGMGDIFKLLVRHVNGDWGDVYLEDGEANDEAVKSGDRILSVYRLAGEKVWIITEADRSATTVLLPEEY